VVNPDGTPNRGKGLTASSKTSTGQYKVRFSQDVSQCAYSVTLDINSGFSFISLTPSDASPRNVFVRTLNRDGVVRDAGFHLVVNRCFSPARAVSA
jgi:hypothetical protein